MSNIIRPAGDQVNYFSLLFISENHFPRFTTLKIVIFLERGLTMQTNGSGHPCVDVFANRSPLIDWIRPKKVFYQEPC